MPNVMRHTTDTHMFQLARGYFPMQQLDEKNISYEMRRGTIFPELEMQFENYRDFHEEDSKGRDI